MNEETDDINGGTEVSLFPLYRNFAEPIKDLVDSLYSVTRKRRISPEHLSMLAKLIYGLQRLPASTEGLCISMSLTRTSDSARGWLGLTLSEEELEIYFGEAFYEPQGVEHAFKYVLRGFVGCERLDDNPDPWIVEQELEGWLNEWRARLADPEIELSISDECGDFDWHQADDVNAWDLVYFSYEV